MTKCGWRYLCESDKDSGMRAVIAIDSEPEPTPAIATDCACEHASDAEPEPVAIPILDPAKGWAYERDHVAEEESSFITSLFEGVPHAVGEQRKQEYLRQKRTAEHLAAGRGHRHD
jgi:hypothetical protein